MLSSLTHLTHYATLQNFLILANAVGSICSVIVYFWSRLPKARKDWYEANTPKLANAMRLLAAIFSDITKAKRAYKKIKSGEQWRAPEAVLHIADGAQAQSGPTGDAKDRAVEDKGQVGESGSTGSGVPSRAIEGDERRPKADRRDGEAASGDASIFDDD